VYTSNRVAAEKVPRGWDLSGQDSELAVYTSIVGMKKPVDRE
jgi:hypothetical protein